MNACAICGQPIENESYSGVTCQRCFDAEAGRPTGQSSFLSKVPVAIAVGLIPFVIGFRSSDSSSSSVDGVVVASSSHSIDYVAVTLGPVAAVLGLISLAVASKQPPETRTRAFALAALGVLLGCYQIYRGLH